MENSNDDEEMVVIVDIMTTLRQIAKRKRTKQRMLRELMINRSLLFTPFKNMKTVNYSSCPLGLEDFHAEDVVVVVKMCGHVFNIRELQTWLKKNKTCPVCGCEIRHGAKIENSDVSDLLVDVKKNIDFDDI
jgi:hypothetical protein